MTDARTTNWRYVVPTTGASLLLLPIDGEEVPAARVPVASLEGLREAIADGPYAAVVAGDVSRWSRRLGLSSTALVAVLADVVAPGGYLYIGYPGRLYPLHVVSRGAVVPWRAAATVRRQGLQPVTAYLAMPSASRPALLVPVDQPAELDYVLQNLSFPYAPSSRPLVGRLRQALVTWMQKAAMRSPHRLRVLCSPGHGLLAVRLVGPS